MSSKTAQTAQNGNKILKYCKQSLNNHKGMIRKKIMLLSFTKEQNYRQFYLKGGRFLKNSFSLTNA